MSLSEIIQRRFKNKIEIKQISTPQDVEKYIISAPKSVNAEQDFDGSLMQFEQDVKEN